MSLTSSAAEPQPSLAWTFESSNVDIVTGLAPSSQVSPGPAQLQGSAALVTDAPTSNTAVYFPGTSGSYMLLNSTPATFDLATSNLFVECWVYFGNVPINPNFTCIVADGPTGSGGGQECWFLRFNSSRVQFTINANTPKTAELLFTFSTSQWYHISASYNSGGSIGYIFVNGGTPNSVSAVTPKTSTGASFTIGAYPSPSSGIYMNGYIRDLRVVQGGVVPTTSFTPGSAPFSYASPGYVTGSGSVVFTLLGQFITYNPSGKYSTSLVLNNNPAWNGSNVYSVYPVLLNSTNTFSVSFWTKVTTTKPNGLNYTAMVGFRGAPVSNASAANYFDINQVGNNGVLAFYGQNGAISPASYAPAINSTTTPAVGTWYHMAWVVNSANFTLYVNGAQSGTTPVVGNAFTVTNMYLATTSQYLTSQSFSGELDDLRIYNTALSAAQVQSIYTQGGAPASSFRVMPQPRLAWTFESSNVDYITDLAPDLSTSGTYAAPTGGTITTVAGQRIHSFTSVGTTSITFLVPVTAQVLVVAGGGGGGGCGTSNQTGGGGGAGELYYNASYSIAPGTYTVTVGAAGTRGLGSGTTGGTPTNGGDSVFGTIDCNGGGRGGASGNSLDNGGSGGSGGGASRSATGGASVKTAAGFGNAGGDSAGSLAGGTAGGGGGGGAGGAGADAGPDNSTRAAGGAGRSYSISGASVTYAEGGRGGSRNGSSDGPAGTTNTGDGGGGGDGNSLTNGGNGGSGIVVISYNAALYPAPTYVTGKYGQAISFNNTLSPTGDDPNCYVTYDISSFDLNSNSAAMSLWLNSGLTYPVTTGNPFYVNLEGSNYNGLYTPNTTSNISFRTGSSPAVTVGNVAAQTSTWNHYCAVFSNVGASASNTISYYYVNGSLIGNANNAQQSFTTLNIGCQNSGSNGALCSIDDVRLFNTALSSAQVQAIYAAQGMPGLGAFANVVGSVKTTLTGTPLFSQLSSTAVSSAVGAFSLRAVNGTSAMAVNVRNGTTSATQDFYADRLGNLLTAPVTGQTLAKWLGGATGYVTTWYDQSGAGNHMSCSSSANQPIFDLVNNFIDLKPSAYFDVSAGTTGPVPFQSSKNYTVVFRHGQFNGSGLFCATQNAAGPYGNLVNNFKKGTGSTYTQYWYGNDVNNKGVLATGNRVSYKWDGTNRSLYVNGTLADATPSSGWAQTSSSIQMIGKTNFDAAMNGELYGAFMFTTALSDADRTLLENFL